MEAEVRPDAILKELNQLWASLGETSGTEAEGVLRACAMTLIVVARNREVDAAVKQALAELMRLHPSRAILLCLRPTPQPLASHISAQCWLPFGRRQQICSEQIEIDADERKLADLPPLVVALAAPDVPAVLWCRDAPLLDTAEVRQIAAAADKVIFDSAGHPEPFPLLERLAPAARPVYADLCWTRLTRWRERIAAVFEAQAQRERLLSVSGLRIIHAGEDVPVHGFYLAAWIAAGLGWAPEDPRIRFERSPAPAAADGIERCLLAGPGLSLSVEGADILQPGEGALLAEELGIIARDPVYDSVWKPAARLASCRRR